MDAQQNKLPVRTLNQAIFMLMVGLIAILSCNKEEDSISTINRDRVRVKEIIRTDEAEVPYDTIQYFYNSDYQPSQIVVHRMNNSDYLSIQFDYTHSTITSNFSGENRTDDLKMNSDGMLTQFLLFENSFELKYNQDGQLIEVNGHDRETSPRKFEFSYEKGNMVKIFDDWGYTIRIEYSDIPNKTNYTLLEQMQLLVGPYFLGLTGKINQNLISRVIFERDTLNYDYVLNKDTLPVKILADGVTTSLIYYY
ncbi:MAG TPA: DUF4595 domain-containing protein [Prolixibacteraceae bacterium]|nr:DUF4595 domain-containing protein [Prolixibacteraceae bacterium]